MQPQHALMPRDPRTWLFTGMSAAAVALAAVAWLRPAAPEIRETEPPPRVERLLRFEDLAGGQLRVTDARTGAVVRTIEGEAGFERGVLRSLMRERRRTGTPGELPLALAVQRNGRLTLSDPATGQRIELEAFGSTNAAAFAPLLLSPGDKP